MKKLKKKKKREYSKICNQKSRSRESEIAKCLQNPLPGIWVFSLLKRLIVSRLNSRLLWPSYFSCISHKNGAKQSNRCLLATMTKGERSRDCSLIYTVHLITAWLTPYLALAWHWNPLADADDADDDDADDADADADHDDELTIIEFHLWVLTQKQNKLSVNGYYLFSWNQFRELKAINVCQGQPERKRLNERERGTERLQVRREETVSQFHDIT